MCTCKFIFNASIFLEILCLSTTIIFAVTVDDVKLYPVRGERGDGFVFCLTH